MNITRPAKSGSALLCHTRWVTQPSANATISPVARREKLGEPSDSQNTPRQKGKFTVLVAPASGRPFGWRRRSRPEAGATTQGGTYSCTTHTRQLELAAGVIEPLVTLQARTVIVFAALTNADQDSPASTE